MSELDTRILEENTEIIGLLYGQVSDELISVYCELNQVLLKSGYDNHLDAFEQLNNALEGDEISSERIAIVVDDTLREAVRVTLKLCGVYYDEDIRITDLVELARAVLDFDITDTPDEILSIIESNEDQYEAFLEVLQYTTSLTVEYWSTLLVEPPYDTGVLDRIKELCTEAISSDVSIDKDPELEKRIARLDEDALTNVTEVPSLESLYQLNLPTLLTSTIETNVAAFRTMSYIVSPDEVSFESNVTKLLDDFYTEPFDRIEAQRVHLSMREHQSTKYTGD